MSQSETPALSHHTERNMDKNATEQLLLQKVIRTCQEDSYSTFTAEDIAFNEQVFLHEVRDFLYYSKCNKLDKTKVFSFLFVRKQDIPNSGWFGFSPFKVERHNSISYFCLRHSLECADVANSVYLCLLDHKMKPRANDIDNFVELLEDENFVVLERYLTVKKALNHQEISDFHSTTSNFYQKGKFQCMAVYCKSYFNPERIFEVMQIHPEYQKEVITQALLDYGITTEMKYELIKHMIKENINFNIVLKLIVNSGEVDFENCFNFAMKSMTNVKSLKMLFSAFNHVSMEHLNEAVKLLIKKSQSTKSEKATKSIIFLLKKTANIALVLCDGDTLVHAAVKISAQTGDLKLLKYVCKHYPFSEDGRVVDEKGRSPYHIAVQNGKIEICEFLRNNGKINPCIVDGSNKTALDYCVGRRTAKCKAILKIAINDWTEKRKSHMQSDLKNLDDSLCLSEESDDKEYNQIKSDDIDHVTDDEKDVAAEYCDSTSRNTQLLNSTKQMNGDNSAHQSSLTSTKPDMTSIGKTDCLNTLRREINETIIELEKVDFKPLVEVTGSKEQDNCMIAPTPATQEDDDDREISDDDREMSNDDSGISDDDSDKSDEELEIPSDYATKKRSDSTDSDNDFNNLLWEVIISKQASDYLKSQKISKHEISHIKQKILRIGNGERTKAIVRKSLQPEDKLYETQYLKSGRIIWQESIEYSAKEERYTDIVKILWITLKHNKTHFSTPIQHIRSALSKTCNSQLLKMVHNPKIKKYHNSPRKFKPTDGKNDGHLNTEKCSPIPNIHDGEFSIMQFHPINDFIEVILSEDPSARECPIHMSNEEHDIVKLPDNEPILLCGRSGTGKTTTCLYRLWHRFLEQQKLQKELGQDEKRCIHQVFLTKSPVLCSKVKRQFDRLLLGRSDLDKDQFDRRSINDFNCLKFQDKHFPLFLSSRKFFLLLDCSLDPSKKSFFPRDGKGKLKVTINSDDYDEDEDPDALFEDLDEEMKSKRDDNYPKWTEVTANYFCQNLWPNLSGSKTSKQYDPLLVWTEIQSFIKGSLKALKSDNGYLSLEQYLGLGRKEAPMLDDKERKEIYCYFEEYKRYRDEHKSTAGDGDQIFDENDFIHDIYLRLENRQNEWYINNFYIDEIQDFTQSELHVLLCCSQDINKSFCTGDVAQCIMKGVHFRFEDLRSQFWKITKEKHGKSMAPQLRNLTKNYRSHSGVLNLGQSVLQILRNKIYFPYSILGGKIGSEEATFDGPKPILLDTTSPMELVELMLGSEETGSAAVHELGAHQAIIVRSQEEKEKLPESLKSGIVLTVLESKGLEFNDVLLYNFFSGLDSKITIPWTLLYNILQDEDEQLPVNNTESDVSIKEQLGIKMIHYFNLTEKKEKQLKSLSAELKHLYTAITRAKKNLWIYEERRDVRNPVFYFWLRKDLASFVKMNEIHADTQIFATATLEEQWKKQGDFFFRMKKWDIAITCYEKLTNTSHVNVAKAYKIVEECKHMSGSKIKCVSYAKAGLYLLRASREEQNEEYISKALICLRKAELHSEAAILFEKTENFKEAAHHWIKAGDYEKAAIIEEKLQNFSEAVRCLKQSGEYDKALSKALFFERTKGEILDIDVNSQQLATKVCEDKAKRNEDLTDILEFIKYGSIKAKFLKEVGQYELAAVELIKEGAKEDAYRLLMGKYLFLEGLEIPELSEYQAEFHFLHFLHLICENEWQVNEEIQQCFNKLQQVSMPPLYLGHAHYAMAKSLKNNDHCMKAIECYKHQQSELGKLNAHKLLIDINEEDCAKPDECIKMAGQAYEFSEYFESVRVGPLNNVFDSALEFFIFKTVGEGTYSIHPVLLKLFSDELKNLNIFNTDEYELNIVKKSSINVALKEYFACLSKQFLSTPKFERHMALKVKQVVTAPFFDDLNSGTFKKSFLKVKFNNLDWSIALKQIVEYNEIMNKPYSEKITRITLVNLLAPFAAYSIPTISPVLKSTLVRKHMMKIAIDLVNSESATLDDFLIGWRILNMFKTSQYEARGIIGQAMNKVNSDYAFSYNNQTIHIFNGWMVSLKQMYGKEPKLTNSIWSIYNYVFTRVAEISEMAVREKALSVQSITYTVSVLTTALTSMIVIAHSFLTVGYNGPQFLLPDFYKILVQNHDAIFSLQQHGSIYNGFYQTEPHKTLQTAIYQMKIFLKFLIGQDKNNYNILQTALESTTCLENGSALYCLNLCLILATNLFKYLSVDFYDKEQKEQVRNILFSIMITLRNCNKHGKSHFINTAYDGMKTARNTGDLYRLIVKLLKSVKPNVLLELVYHIHGQMQFQPMSQHSYPTCTIKSLVIIERPPTDEEQQEVLKNPSLDDVDYITDKQSDQTLLKEIESQDMKLITSPYIQDGCCKVCGIKIEKVNEKIKEHLKDTQHLMKVNLYDIFSKIMGDICELYENFQKELQSEEHLSEIIELKLICESELKQLKRIQTITTDKFTWTEGIEKVRDIQEKYKNLRTRYDELKAKLATTEETNEQVYHQNDDDIQSEIIPLDTQQRTLHKPKKKQ